MAKFVYGDWPHATDCHMRPITVHVRVPYGFSTSAVKGRRVKKTFAAPKSASPTIGRMNADDFKFFFCSVFVPVCELRVLIVHSERILRNSGEKKNDKIRGTRSASDCQRLFPVMFSGVDSGHGRRSRTRAATRGNPKRGMRAKAVTRVTSSTYPLGRTLYRGNRARPLNAPAIRPPYYVRHAARPPPIIRPSVIPSARPSAHPRRT